eukprot:TRINITY_DN19194_c0_g3_i1.p1 TRINITY_DN19194_c0_g3~~TRINITY_DN19194_c0_g3_i1.p1  ORF type:complete len:534 (+),score=133.51 TRINITY_DN19194_c0_g3_i1:98-1603(+)
MINLLLSLLLIALTAGASDVASLLKECDALIIQGRSKYREVVQKLNQILDTDPNNQKALYKRAEVRGMLKDNKKALADLSAHIAIKKTKQALQLRSKINTKTGNFEDAAADYMELMQIYSQSSSKHEKTKKFAEAKERVQTLRQLNKELEVLNRELQQNPKDVELNRKCVSWMDQYFIKEAKDTDKFRLQKIDCAIACKDHDAAQSELSYILAVQPQNLGAIYLKALSMKNMGASDAAIANLKRCLSLDPEYKDCMKLHKQIKKYNKVTDKFEKSINDVRWGDVLLHIDESLNMDSDPHNIDRLYFYKCKAHLEKRTLEEGKASCSDAIAYGGKDNPSSWELLVFRAEIHMLGGELDKAEEDLRAAAELNRNERRIREAQSRLETLKARANRKDHYKILGVPLTATASEIKKAYRKLAMKHHPDKVDVETEEEREKVNETFRDISNAYQVLSNEDLRRRYDAGEDIDDTSGGQQQQHHHHHHGFNNFNFGGGGGGFHFKFG